MKKVLYITGMSCGHCQARVEKALNSIAGARATVDLKKARAIVRLNEAISDEKLIRAVESAGYSVTSVQEKKGFFS